MISWGHRLLLLLLVVLYREPEHTGNGNNDLVDDKTQAQLQGQVGQP